MEERPEIPEVNLNDGNNGGNAEKSLLPTFNVKQLVKQCLSRPGCCLRIFNIVFYAILLIVLLIVQVPQHRSSVGTVYGLDEVVEPVPQPNGTITGTFGDLGHPITVANEICTVGILWSCVNEGATGLCCDELNNPRSSGPENTVSEHLLIMISVVLPFALIVIRIVIMAYLCVKYNTESWRTYSGFYSIDGVIGFAATIVLSRFFSELCKKYVGAPRPNFYAVRFWEENAVAGSSNLDGSYDSWASGHAADSMAAGIYIILILWSDLRAAFSLCMKPILSAALQSLGHLLCCAIIYGYAFVGFTRIRDYWHHSVDVVTGWIIGTAAAFVAFAYVTKGPFDLNLANDKRKRDLASENQ